MIKQRFKYLENEKSFQGKIKKFFIIFKWQQILATKFKQLFLEDESTTLSEINFLSECFPS